MTNRIWTPLTRSVPVYKRDQMRVTLTPQGMLLINQFAFHALRSREAVAFYEKTTGSIGIAPAKRGDPNALCVRQRSKGKQRAICLLHFCSRFGLARPKNAVTFPNPTFDPDGMLVLDHRGAVSELERKRVAELQ